MTKYELTSLIVALVALAQPWVAAGWRKLARRAKLEAFPVGRLEVGYDQFGPLVTLHGTLRARGHSVFVTRMTARVTRLADNATWLLEWFVFTPERIGGADMQQAYELAHPFSALEDQPTHYHVACRSPSLERETSELLDAVRSGWQMSPVNRVREETLEAHGNLGPAIAEREQKEFAEYLNRPEVGQAYSELERRCIWSPGRYRLAIEFYSAERKPPFAAIWYFALNPDESKRLRLNAIAIMNKVCGQRQDWRLNFIYPDYEQE